MNGLPYQLRQDLIASRHAHGWSQAELGRRLGIPQAHISGIETGKIVPRFDTLLDLVRVLDNDILIVPRTLVPAMQALIRDHKNPDKDADSSDEERPLYALDEDSDSG